jgi:hypothetical protein
MAKKEGPHYRFQRLEFYANQGMITLIDLDKAADSSVTPDEAIQRLRPGQFIKRVIAVRMGTKDMYPDETMHANRLLEEATAACKLAKSQGDPLDTKVQDHMLKHNKRSRILVSGGSPISTAEANKLLGPVGGQYKIRNNGNARTTLLQGNVDVVPDFTIPGTQMVTPDKIAPVKKGNKR